IVLAVAVGVAAFGLMITGRTVLEENLRAVYAGSGPAQTVLVMAPFNDSLLKIVQSMDGVQHVEARQWAQARLQIGPEDWVSLNLQSLPDFDLNLNKLIVERGALVPPPPGSILLERSLQTLMKVGGTVNVEMLNGDVHTLKVAGFVNDLSILPASISLTATGYITPQTATGLNLPRSYNRLYLTFKDTSNRAVIERQLTSVVKELKNRGYIVYSAPVPPPDKYVLGDNMTSVLFILGALGLLTLILSAFLVSSVMSAVMNQQVPQIGILKSLGARLNQTLGLYFQEVLLFGIFALILAVPMGMIGAYFLATGVADGMNFDITHFSLPNSTLALQAASALLAPLLAASVPILNGARITIRQAISSYNAEEATSLGWLARLRELPQLMNLSLRNTFRRKGRLALTFAALILAGSMFIAVIGIRQSMRAAVRDLQGDLNYDVGLDLDCAYLEKDIRDTAKNVSGISAVETWMVSDGRLIFQKDKWLSGSIVLNGVPADTVMAQPDVTQGRWLNPGDQYAIFVNADFLDLSPDLKVGSVITLDIGGQTQNWQIVGASGRGFLPTAYVHQDDLEKVVGQKNLANRLVVQSNINTPAAQSELESALLSQFHDAKIQVTASETTAQLKESTAAQMDTLIILLLAMVILIAIVGGLGLAITMGLNVLERTREIGILRSLGARNGVVRRVVIVEGVVIGVLSWILSVPVSIPLAIWLGNVLGVSLLARPLDYQFSFLAAGLWLGLVIVISVLASLLPAQNAARLTIRDALVYE
ncbi:MAG TPA: ABC transporter permease, partial [Anaerolineales bacterium]|nr:ABC transporter permease [Anaerolineales bacterium]